MVRCYHPVKLDHKKSLSTGKVYIKGLERFWRYAKERSIKHHGVAKEKVIYCSEL